MNFAICVFHSFTFCIICTVFTPILYPILLYTVPNLIFNIYKNRFAQVFRRLFLGIPSCGLFIEIGRIGFKQWSNVFFFRAFRSSNKKSMVHILYPSREMGYRLMGQVGPGKEKMRVLCSPTNSIYLCVMHSIFKIIEKLAIKRFLKILFLQ